MRYIRTENGIWQLDDLDCVRHPCGGVTIHKSYLDIIKQSNNIEKLCDEFIVISDNCKRPIISALPYSELKLYAKNRTEYATCYGAIWTEKGLIYVAKMNDKGELELL